MRNRMAEGEGDEYNIPLVLAADIDLNNVKVVITIPDLKVSSKLFGTVKPKNATVTKKFETNSLEVTAMVKKNKKEIKYRKIVRKLPGEIIPDRCKIKYKKGFIILILAKAKESSWSAQLSKKGKLDQAEDD